MSRKQSSMTVICTLCNARTINYITFNVCTLCVHVLLLYLLLVAHIYHPMFTVLLVFIFLFVYSLLFSFFFFFFFNDTATTEIYTLSLHDALPISCRSSSSSSCTGT